MPVLTIGITDCSKYDIYHNWVAGFTADLRLLRLTPGNNTIQDAAACDGILLSGGEDVHPRFYHKPEYLGFCYPDDINEMRDEFELELIEFTQRKEIPLFGICRGLQITNVFFGGTLIPDLPTWGKQGHAKQANGSDSYHKVHVSGGQSGVSGSFEVNSNHHQAIENIAGPLVITAYSTDGIPEAAERTESGRSFLELVQWHPERMKDQQSLCSRGLLADFLRAAETFHLCK